MTHNTKAGKIILETIPLRTKKSAVGLAQAAGRDNLAAVRRRATDAHLRKMEKAAAKQAVLDKSPGKKKSDEGVEPPAKKTKKTSTLKLTPTSTLKLMPSLAHAYCSSYSHFSSHSHAHSK